MENKNNAYNYDRVFSKLDLETVWYLAQESKYPRVKQQAKRYVIEQLVSATNEKEFLEKVNFIEPDEEEEVLEDGRGAYSLDRQHQ